MPVRKILLFLWLFSAVGGEHPKIYRSAQEGGQVEIPCRYDSGDLNLNDAGTYWCFIDAYTFDPITEIQLEVYKAQKPQKPPPVPLTPPTVTSVQTNTRKQQQSATTTGHLNWTKNGSNTTSTPSAETHTASPSLVSSPLAGKELHVAAAAVVLLLSLLVVLYCRQKKHRRSRERAAFERDDASQTNTSSSPVHLENQSQQREPDPSVSPPGSMYAEVTRPRRPDDHTSVCHPVSVQTHVVHPEFSETLTSGPRDESSAPTISQQGNICRTSTEAGDQHAGEDVLVVYSTIRFSTDGSSQPRRETGSAAGPSDVYATVRRPKT